MWDRPEVLSRVSAILFAVAGLMFLYALLWVVVRQPVFALRHIDLTGDARHITASQVDAIVTREVNGTFFTLDLPRVRRAFEKLPWVRDVRLRRHWPDRLEVSVAEHVPLARWGRTALVNTHGEVFHAAHGGELPVFVGPEGTSKEVAIQYEHFRRSLAAIGAKPVLVRVSARRAWQVRLDNGQTLELGREDVEVRLERYVEVYAYTVGALDRRVDYVDLRYANGFAVRIPELKGEPQRARGRKKVSSAGRRTGGAVPPKGAVQVL